MTPTTSSGTGGRTCYCHRCDRHLHPRGVGRHRAMHRDRGEDVTLDLGDGPHHYTYSRLIHGQTSIYDLLPAPAHHTTKGQQKARQDALPAGPDPTRAPKQP